MKSITQDKFFNWVDWDEPDHLVMMYFNVNITKDFGPLKKDTHYDTLIIDYANCTISVEQEEKEVNKFIYDWIVK